MRAVSGVPGVPGPEAPGAEAPGAEAPRRAPGRWVWAVSGVVTAALLTVPAARLVAHSYSGPQDAKAVPGPPVTFTVSKPVNAVDVHSDGGPVRITGGAVSRVTVTEPAAATTPPVPAGSSGSSAAPSPVTVRQPPVTGGQLTLSPAYDGPAPITLTVPRNTAVTVTTASGPVWVSGLSGPLTVDSGGGPVSAWDLTSANATVTSGGGPAALSFAASPAGVSVLTEGGPARIGLPRGPYALNASSGGGPEQVGVATDPAARRTLSVSTGGGPLLVGPPSSVPASSLPASPGSAPAKPAAPAAPGKG